MYLFSHVMCTNNSAKWNIIMYKVHTLYHVHTMIHVHLCEKLTNSLIHVTPTIQKQSIESTPTPYGD